MKKQKYISPSIDYDAMDIESLLASQSPQSMKITTQEAQAGTSGDAKASIWTEEE